MPAELPAVVPGPVPPDDSDAWYAPEVRAQYHVISGVVATVSESDDTYQYRTREPVLSSQEAETKTRIEKRFQETSLTRPRTREGAIDRMQRGLPDTWNPHLPGLSDHSPAGRRRLEYHLGTSLRALGDLTPLALDDRIRIGDTSRDHLTVHTKDFAPAVTDLKDDTPHLQRFLSERVDTERVTFQGFEIPVTVYRRKVLGADRFHTRYDVQEPDRLPGDRELLAAVTTQLLETPPDTSHDDQVTAILNRARTLLRRRLVYRDTANAGGPLRRVAGVLNGWFGWDRAGPKVTPGSDRVEDLVYYVARELVGEGALTIPLRDPRLRSIEVTAVGEQVTVLPHRGAGIGHARMPATCSVEGADEFRRLARTLAAAGGVELSGDRPTAAVDLEGPGRAREGSQRCSVSLPSADGTAHISITSERDTPPTPIALVSRGVLTAEMVATIWTVAENRGVVVLVGPARAEPAVALAAHVPFIPPSVRPVSVAHGNQPVALPQETGIALQRTPDLPGGPMGLGDGVAIDSDLLVLPDIELQPAMRRFGEVIASGRGIVAAARTTDREFFTDIAAGAGLSALALGKIDLLVELPDPEVDSPATAWMPNSKSSGQPPAVDSATPAPDTDGVSWIRIGELTGDRVASTVDEQTTGTKEGVEQEQPRGRNDQDCLEDFASALAGSLSVQQTPADLSADLIRRRQYVEYLRTAGVTDRSSLLGFLSDLRTDEAATVERIHRTLEK